jgi:hypothetical protein
MKPLIRSSLDSFLGRICIDLDDFDRIVDLLRRHCRSVQIVAHDVLIEDSSQLQGLRDSPVRDLEIEAHDPFLRIRFGPIIRNRKGWTGWTGGEVVSDPNDSVAASLLAQIEVILEGARRQGPISILAGFTGNERRSILIVGLIPTLFMVVPLLFPGAGSLVNDFAVSMLLITLGLAVMMIFMTILMPCAPVLLLQRGRVTGRTKLEPKPDPIADL